MAGRAHMHGGQGAGYGNQGYGYGPQGYGYGQVRNPIPPGWFECPPIGQVCRDTKLAVVHKMIPMKVPLGNNRRVPNMELQTRGHWTPLEALHEADRIIKEVDPAATVGTVLDLSNTDKYYDRAVIEQSNVRYVKVPCRGRGVSPDPLAVNMAVWEIRKALSAEPHNYILVHCTHGYNRSGFIIVCAMMRLLADQGFCVARGLKRFVEQRPPGIYKDGYIKDLFKRHNEHRPALRECRTPPLPDWKPADDPDEDERPGNGLQSAPEPQAPARMSHADKIGEPISTEEARYIMNCVYDIIQAQDITLKGGHLLGFPHEQKKNKEPGELFIGSQPVSLDLDNLELIRQKRYYVSWKADGTRYLLLCMREGAYFIDRSGEVRRAQMRFPTIRRAAPGQHPVGPPHHWTLLDGEMVVDEVDISGEIQKRRYLAYDCMMLCGEGLSDLRFKDRLTILEREVVGPRYREQEYFADMYRKPGAIDKAQFIYDPALEVSAVRKKDFHPLTKAEDLLMKLIPQLCHESDGLILQPADDPYIPRTYPHLLKWKFRHMNSVDFKLQALHPQPPVLMLNCAYRRKHGQMDTNHRPLSDIGVPHATVEFPPNVDPYALHGKIIECSFDADRRVWLYMRERTDKLTANHNSVFEKVMGSIESNITEEFLLAVFKEALQLPHYATDAQRAQNPPAAVAVQAGHGYSSAPQQQQQQPQQSRLPLPQPAHQQQHSAQQSQQQAAPPQQRHSTPEIQQQPGQWAPPPGYRGPSPILTPPPGAEDGSLGNGLQQHHHHQQQQQQQQEDAPTAAQPSTVADGPAELHVHREIHQVQELNDDADDDMDLLMQQAEQDGDQQLQDEDEHQEYHVTEQDDLEDEGGEDVEQL